MTGGVLGPVQAWPFALELRLDLRGGETEERQDVGPTPERGEGGDHDPGRGRWERGGEREVFGDRGERSIAARTDSARERRGGFGGIREDFETAHQTTDARIEDGAGCERAVVVVAAGAVPA